MFRKQQIEVIDFKTFMAGNYRKPKRLINTSVYSFMPSITISSFFSMSPGFATLYGVVIGVGLLGILSHCLEVTAANAGHEELAMAIETVTRLAFSIGGFSFIGWFLLSI
ncbi:hypothetical protein SC499_20290 [Peribacillus simplex]|uniref:hypothetical protein n=1 Tax=Peribacillus simplex TaxID=1478 RepID=UPI00298D6846|nr:hypothetical protein [Peribacillus simplex]MDW7616990.1 hypothetical protein [Peribacillus simplex]